MSKKPPDPVDAIISVSIVDIYNFIRWNEMASHWIAAEKQKLLTKIAYGEEGRKEGTNDGEKLQIAKGKKNDK